jgi:hypothetical protein
VRRRRNAILRLQRHEHVDEHHHEHLDRRILDGSVIPIAADVLEELAQLPLSFLTHVVA